jgi:hypothetical protein
MGNMHLIVESEVYRLFQLIPESAYQTKVYFFERNQEQLGQIDEAEQLEIWLGCADAFFEIGEFKRYLSMVQPMTTLALEAPITSEECRVVLGHILFKRSAALYNLSRWDDCLRAVKELVRVDPQNPENKLFLKRVLLKIKREGLKKPRAATLLMFILATICIAINILVVHSFFPTYFFVGLWCVAVLLGAGFLNLFWFEGKVYYQVYRQTTDFCTQARKHQAEKQKF